MKLKYFAIQLISIIVLFVFIIPAHAASPDFSGDPGYQAFTKAINAKKYLMINLFSGKQKPSFVKSVEDARKDLKESLEIVNIDVQGSGSEYLIDKYRLKFAPVPLAILVAPNGVLVGSFRSSFTPEKVKSAFKTPKTLKCLLAFQERKLVFISAQGADTSENKEALAGINRFMKENPFYGLSEVIIVDPKNSAEAPLLAQLNVKPDIKQAQTFMLVPPGRIMGRWVGATDSKAFLKRLNMLAKSCSSPSCKDPNCK